MIKMKQYVPSEMGFLRLTLFTPCSEQTCFSAVFNIQAASINGLFPLKLDLLEIHPKELSR